MAYMISDEAEQGAVTSTPGYRFEYEENEEDEVSMTRRRRSRIMLLGIICTIFGICIAAFVVQTDKAVEVNDPEVIAKEVVVKFSDVYGCDEAKKQLETAVKFLKSPKDFEKYGAKMPRGYLLAGPPGVGKTLLARAIAGESGVPFIYASGASFDEMYVGVGAQRVRNLFELARDSSDGNAVIFIDEIDAMASKRNNFSADTSRQTLNELLTQMDGYLTGKVNIIVLAATNTPEMLDEALLRPGRFDKILRLTPPNKLGRINHLTSLMGNVSIESIADDLLGKKDDETKFDFDWLAELTEGYTGAELANLVNQAKIMAAVENLEEIEKTDKTQNDANNFSVKLSRKHFENAKNFVLDDSNSILTPSSGDNLRKNYREAGKLVVEKFGVDTYAKAGGHSIGDCSDSILTIGKLKIQLMSSLSGVAAEIILVESELKNNNSKITGKNTFESNDFLSANLSQDFKNANELAKRLVLNNQNYFFDFSSASENSKFRFEEEVKNLVTEFLNKTIKILRLKQNLLEKVREAITERKTREQIDKILKNSDESD